MDNDLQRQRIALAFAGGTDGAVTTGGPRDLRPVIAAAAGAVPGPRLRVLLVAPHPDDFDIVCGTAAAMAVASAGWEIRVTVLSCGSGVMDKFCTDQGDLLPCRRHRPPALYSHRHCPKAPAPPLQDHPGTALLRAAAAANQPTNPH